MKNNNVINEMAVLCSEIKIPKNKKTSYNVELHGFEDRIYPPHFHVYGPKGFNMEVNLMNYLNTDSIVFCRIKSENKLLKTAKDCERFPGVLQFKRSLKDMLESKPTSGDFQNASTGLEAALLAFAQEADMTQLHNEDVERFKKEYGDFFVNMKPEAKILFVMLSMNKSILEKFHKYFPEKLRKKFPTLFS